MKEEVRILWEDQSLLLCVKPAGILSQPAPTEEEDLLTLLQRQRPYVAAVHRLDRAVGGVMVFAKTPAAAAGLSEKIRQQQIRKEYLAVVSGCPTDKEGVLKDLLLRDSAQNKTYVVDRLRKGVREASLEYRVLQTVGQGEEQCSLLRIRLHTGRSHQIRVQFASRGYPLLGDGRYGSRRREGGVALWSARLSFTHPLRHMDVQGEALPPVENWPWKYFQWEKGMLG